MNLLIKLSFPRAAILKVWRIQGAWLPTKCRQLKLLNLLLIFLLIALFTLLLIFLLTALLTWLLTK
jgi:hypothetical protein